MPEGEASPPNSPHDQVAIPKEPNPMDRLFDLVKAFRHWAPHEKEDYLNRCHLASATELREMAGRLEEPAEEILADPKTTKDTGRMAIDMQNLATALKDVASFQERADQEITPEEAIAQARTIYEGIVAEAKGYSVEHEMTSPLMKTVHENDQELAEYYIGECEKKGFVAPRLVAFHIRHGQLSEVQKLASVARNRLNASLILQSQARDLEMRLPRDNDHRDRLAQIAKEDLELADQIRQEYRIFARAARAMIENQEESQS